MLPFSRQKATRLVLLAAIVVTSAVLYTKHYSDENLSVHKAASATNGKPNIVLSIKDSPPSKSHETLSGSLSQNIIKFNGKESVRGSSSVIISLQNDKKTNSTLQTSVFRNGVANPQRGAFAPGTGAKAPLGGLAKGPKTLFEGLADKPKTISSSALASASKQGTSGAGDAGSTSLVAPESTRQEPQLQPLQPARTFASDVSSAQENTQGVADGPKMAKEFDKTSSVTRQGSDIARDTADNLSIDQRIALASGFASDLANTRSAVEEGDISPTVQLAQMAEVVLSPGPIPDKDSIFEPSAAADNTSGSNPSVSSPDPDLDVVCAHMVYAERRQRADNICLKQRQGAALQLLHYGKVSYCMVPKVGCTFWLNVFRFLHQDTGSEEYPTPFHIPRVITHYGRRDRMKFYRMGAETTPPHLLTDFRFMFVRDPWSRLWSAYLDKFFLIDFWPTDGQDIVRRRKVKVASTRCARDITFKEFVDFVVSTDWRFQNLHWRPVQYQCSPCVYRPHVIGKMETFAQDSRFLLGKVDLTWILNNYTHDTHVHREMDMLIDYNFGMMAQNKFFWGCTNATDLSYRLWRTFQFNGYLPMEAAFPEVNAPSIGIHRFKTLVHEAYRNRPVRSPQQWKQQRDKAMIDAYRDISPENIAKLQQLYQGDFELFDYDSTPPGLSEYHSVHGTGEPSCLIK